VLVKANSFTQAENKSVMGGLFLFGWLVGWFFFLFVCLFVFGYCFLSSKQ